MSSCNVGATLGASENIFPATQSALSIAPLLGHPHRCHIPCVTAIILRMCFTLLIDPGTVKRREGGREEEQVDRGLYRASHGN